MENNEQLEEIRKKINKNARKALEIIEENKKKTEEEKGEER